MVLFFLLIDHYDNDDNIKEAYSLATKEGLDQSINFQLLLVGAENTGKTNLIFSLLNEKFVEEQPSTKGADLEVCKVYCKDWIRISNSDKGNMLGYQVTKQVGDEVRQKKIVNPQIPPSSQPRCYNPPSLPKKSSIVESFTSVRSFGDSFKQCLQNMPNTSSKAMKCNSDSLIASLWDFAGEEIFHNSHSVFISDGGVTVITFNAFLELKDKINPREGSRRPPECCTAISSIHYWLQVVNSVCSVEENVLLVGTHIDKLHSDLKEARKIASNKILPVLEEELCGKAYNRQIACIHEGLKSALEHSCFFISNKCRDKEIECLKVAAIRVATSLREEKPIYYLKIEQELLQHNKQVISISMMLDLVAGSTFPLDLNSPKFKIMLKYFHNNRTILHFSQIESLKDLVILSPHWLAKLFSYIITAQSYKTGSEFDWAWKRLNKYGILHECLLKHMLKKFHLDHHQADLIQVTKEQAVDILLCFRLLARITSKAWFTEEGPPRLPKGGDTFIVPSLVCADDDKNPPKTEQERIVYFVFNDGFVPTSLLNQLIAECICRSVKRNDPLLW